MCGHCGYHMQTVYKHTPRYVCRGMVRTTIARSDCNSVRSPVVDQVVVQAFFEAIQPAKLDALEEILAAQRLEQERLEQHWQEQLKRMQYEARLAQRQYDAVDPDNRLVAAELERRWESSLQQLRQTQEAFDHFQQAPPPDRIPSNLREMFQNVSNRLPELWPSLSNPQRKELLRSLIRQVIIKRPVPDHIEIRIVWVSNCYTDHTCLTPIHGERNVSGYDRMVTRIEELCKQGYDDQQMAEQLIKEGYHSARSTTGVTARSVQKIRLKRNWNLRFTLLRSADEWDDHWTVNGLARECEVNESTIYRFIYAKVIPAEFVFHEQQTGIYLFPKDDQLIALIKKSLGHPRKNRTNQQNPH